MEEREREGCWQIQTTMLRCIHPTSLQLQINVLVCFSRVPLPKHFKRNCFTKDIELIFSSWRQRRRKKQTNFPILWGGKPVIPVKSSSLSHSLVYNLLSFFLTPPRHISPSLSFHELKLFVVAKAEESGGMIQIAASETREVNNKQIEMYIFWQ